MKAYVFSTGRIVEPFLDPPARLPILEETLENQRARVLAEAGVEDVSDLEAPVQIGTEPALLLFDHCYLTARTARELVRHADALKGSTAVLALPRGPLTEFAGPLQDRVSEEEGGATRVLFDAYLVRDIELDPGEGAGALRARLLQNAERITLEPRVEVRFQRWPNIKGEKLGIELPRSLWGAGHLDHWVNLLWLNRQTIETRLLEMAEAEAEQGRTFLFARREFERWSSRRKPPVYVGENCNIHSTALLENAVLGDNVSVDIRSMVLDSVLADSIGFSAATNLKGCFIGSGCHTLSDTTFIECFCMPRSSLANAKLQHVLVGREAFITTGVMFHEVGIDGDIEVEQDGRWVSSGRRILGGCIGHRCILGARAMFHGGRAVPNGYMIVMKPGEGVTKLPPNLEGRLVYNEDGALRPVDDIVPAWQPPEW